jgi:hypothetical protein
MKRNLIIVCLPMVLLLMLGSCRKFIQVPPPTNAIVTSEVFTDSASAIAGITGIYINMWNRGSNTIGSGSVDLYAGASSDEMTGTSTVSFMQEIDQDNITITNSYVQGMWTNAYSYIYGANACIYGATASTTLAPTVQNRVVGEAKFIRAFMHFNLVNLFGPVPLVITTDYNVTASLARASVDSIYAQILADLHAADSLLSPDPVPVNRVRANRYTVSALLARVSLYRQQWADAESYATRAIGGNYTLQNNLDSVFLNGSTEAIWQMPSAGLGNETAIGQIIIPYSSGVLPQYVATPQIVAAFEPGDKRPAHWMQSTVVAGTTWYYPYKYKLPYDNNTTPKEAYMIFRLAELYLIRAEARAEQGDLSDAISDLNVIRTRAGLPPTTASAQPDLLAAIQHERQTELCFEWGHRWYDLKRTGTVNTVLGPPGNVKPAWKPSAALYPIPYAQTQLDPFLTQNPGYN